MEFLSEKVLEALEFAAVAHKEQVRKNPGGIPYVSHVAAVGLVLARAGYPDEVVIAGVLHDVIEDTDYTADDIRERFGDEVTDIVLGVTENKKLQWDERQKDYYENLANHSAASAAVSAADLLANRLSMIEEFRKGNNPWVQLSRSPQAYAEKVLRYDAERIGLIKQKVDHEFVRELERVQQEVVAFTENLQW